MERPRRRRHHPPGVEEALSSMLWRPYDRTTPSESSDDDERPQSTLPLPPPSAIPPPTQTFLPYGWQLALTPPVHHGIESKFNQNASPGYESHMYSDPIRYNMMPPSMLSTSSSTNYRMFTKSAAAATKTINTQPSNGLSFSSVVGHQPTSGAASTTSLLPSYEKIERHSRHWSNAIDEVAAANGIYFIPPSNLQRTNANHLYNSSAGMVNSFTDDFMQYQVSAYLCVFF